MANPRDTGNNPPFNVPPRDPPAVARAKCRDWHRRAGTMETFYLLYPDERPVREPPVSRGR